MNDSNMIIIGAGIAGGMARGYFSLYLPQVFEANSDSRSDHKAIMRYREESIGFLLGLPLEKVHVRKAIFYKGEFTDANPMVLNLYSRKVAKGIYERSINLIESVDRFISKEALCIPSVNYGFRLDKIEPNICHFTNGHAQKYDICISTIPLLVMAKAAGLSLENVKIESYPICVTRFSVKVPSSVYQTVYFPDLDIPIYRVSLEENKFIIESQDVFPTKDQMSIAMSVFGLESKDLNDQRDFVQENGKIVEMDDTERKRIIMELTDRFSVYSLGRYATWRNITSDVLLDDLPKLARLMKLSNSSRKYSMALGEHE